MKKLNSRPITLILCTLLVASLLACPLLASVALARAGGGDRIPGTSPSGGGSGDADGLFYLIFWVLLSRLPWPLKIIVIIAILAFLGYGGRRKLRARSISAGGYPAYSSTAPVVSGTRIDASMLDQRLSELKERDPNFSERQFEDMASTAFFKIQEAWAARDMGIANSFVTPSLLSRFQTQISELKKLGHINQVEQAAIASLDIVEADNEGGFDYISVRINAAAADYTVDEKTSQVVSGSKQIKPFTEYWTFLRSDKVKTPEGKPELISQKCPNCGAPIQVNAVGQCDYCGSDITSGKFSWVLSEITQEGAWRPRVQAVRPPQVSPLAGQRYVLGLVQCPNCGANVQDIQGITQERCWRCGATVPTEN